MQLFDEINPEYIKDTGISIEILNITFIKPHRHPSAIEMIYCLKGSFTIQIAHESITCYAGQMVTADHCDIHYISADEDNVSIIVHLDISNTHYSNDEMRAILFSCSTALIRDNQIPYLNEIYDKILAMAYIYSSHQKDPSDALHNLKQIRLDMIDLLVQKFSWYSVLGFTLEENEKYRERINAISLYIQDNCREKITLAKIAKVAHFDSNYLSGFMKRTSMRSYSFTVNYFRCYEAESLLLSTKKTVEEISDTCGFSSKKYFHKHFKEIWNITPLQHRKRYESLFQTNEEYLPLDSNESLELVKETIISRQLNNVYMAGND